LTQVIDFLGQGKYCDAIGKLDGVIIQIEGAIDQVNEQRCSVKECKEKECKEKEWICIADEAANELIECLEQAKQGAIAIGDLISAEHPECAHMV
jgi:chorismate synthase